MTTEPNKCLNSVLKVNMGGIRKFSISCNNANYFANCWFHCDLFSAVMLRPLAWADRLCLCWLFICRASLSFYPSHFLFSLRTAQSTAEPSSPCAHSQPGQDITKVWWVSWEQEMLLLFPTTLSLQRWSFPSPFATKFKKSRILPRSQTASQEAGLWDLLGMVALKLMAFVLGRERGTAIFTDSKGKQGHRESPGKLVGIFYYCLYSSPWKLMGA